VRRGGRPLPVIESESNRSIRSRRYSDFGTRPPGLEKIPAHSRPGGQDGTARIVEPLEPTTEEEIDPQMTPMNADGKSKLNLTND
jgi:hypothetical protein